MSILTVEDGSFRENAERFPPAIQERLERTYRANGWALTRRESAEKQIPLAPGSTIGKGWIPLVEELDARLAKIDPDYQLLQIKEKFRLLTVIAQSQHSDKDQWYDTISEYTRKSADICQFCGLEPTCVDIRSCEKLVEFHNAAE